MAIVVVITDASAIASTMAIFAVIADASTIAATMGIVVVTISSRVMICYTCCIPSSALRSSFEAVPGGAEHPLQRAASAWRAGSAACVA